MIGRYLNAPYKDREKVKALGARWDPEQRQWYVPHGRDLAPFAAWLPDTEAAPALAGVPRNTALLSTEPEAAPWDAALPATAGGSVALARGVSLSQLMAGVGQAVAQAYRAGVWTRVEVVKADVRRGHVYLELAERDAQGQTVAQARGTLWADTAQQLLPAFEAATGVVLGAGIKLLLRARPQLHALYGLSLQIDAIDPDYTLGDLEAKKREIRQRLQREGLWDANRRLPAPWDFEHVLVLAPEAAAGLGDFQAEARRLAEAGVCEFVYAHARFQGEGAPQEIRQALLNALAQRQASGRPGFDVVVLIRGGGAVNDLAWLNDYTLARCLCELPVPLFTGIGHERDNTVLDELAHQRFDTPSKVVLGIQQHIVQRVRQAQAYRQQVVESARAQLAQARQTTQHSQQQLRGWAQQALSQARHTSQAQWHGLRLQAQRQLAQARQQVPARLATVQAQAVQALAQARHSSQARCQQVLAQATQASRLARQRCRQSVEQVRDAAHQQPALARQHSQALVREITGQGPEATLRRGFALVRDAQGRALASAGQVAPGQALQLQFHDGALAVQAGSVGAVAPADPATAQAPAPRRRRSPKAVNATGSLPQPDTLPLPLADGTPTPDGAPAPDTP